jgi:hypothetical protein
MPTKMYKQTKTEMDNNSMLYLYEFLCINNQHIMIHVLSYFYALCWCFALPLAHTTS